jgi:hypothetical protein
MGATDTIISTGHGISKPAVAMLVPVAPDPRLGETSHSRRSTRGRVPRDPTYWHALRTHIASLRRKIEMGTDGRAHVGPNLSVLTRLASWPSATSASATASTNPVGPQT